MARTKEYPHYCPVALTLETVGEKWSLLIVRDLLFGPQRFTDLLGSLGGITPKWLTLRLRELEASGVVERDQVAGRREVWYQLTPKGQDLMPVIEALVGWGLHYTRPPQPGDVVHSWRAVALAAFIFNQSGMRLTHPRTWVVRFAADQAHALHFDGERWTYQRDAVGDVAIETKPKAWLAFLAAAPGERARLLADLHITGKPAPVAEFETAFTSDHA